jgi:hypothetical protein
MATPNEEKLKLVLEAEDRMSQVMKALSELIDRVTTSTSGANEEFKEVGKSTAQVAAVDLGPLEKRIAEVEAMLAAASTQAADTAAQMGQVAQAEAEVTEATQDAANELDKLSESTKLSDRAMEKFTREAEQLERQLAESDKAAEEAARSIEEMGKMVTKRYDTAQLREIEDELDEIDKKADGAGRQFGSMGVSLKGLGTLAAAGLAAIAGFIAGVAVAADRLMDAGLAQAERIDRIVRSAQTMGTTVEQYQSLALVGKQAGASVEQLEMGLKVLNQRLAEAASGNKVAIESFKIAGVQYQDTAGKLRPAYDVLLDIAEQTANNENASQKLLVAQKLLGEESAFRLLPALNRGAEGFKNASATVREYGASLTATAKTNAEDIRAAHDRIGLSLEGLGNKFVELYGEEIVNLMDTTANVIVSVGDLLVEHEDKLVGVFDAITWAVGLAEGAVNSLSRVMTIAFPGDGIPSIRKIERDTKELFEAQKALNGPFVDYNEFLQRRLTITRDLGHLQFEHRLAAGLERMRKELDETIPRMQKYEEERLKAISAFGRKPEPEPDFSGPEGRLREYEMRRAALMAEMSDAFNPRPIEEVQAALDNLERQFLAFDKAMRSIEAGEVLKGVDLERLRSLGVDTGRLVSDLELMGAALDEVGVKFRSFPVDDAAPAKLLKLLHSAVESTSKAASRALDDAQAKFDQAAKFIEERGRAAEEQLARSREAIFDRIAAAEQRRLESSIEGLRELERREIEAARRMLELHQISQETFGKYSAAVNEDYNQRIHDLVNKTEDESLSLSRSVAGQFVLITDESMRVTANWAEVTQGYASDTFFTIGNEASDAFSAIIEGTKSAEDAFAEMAESIIKDIERMAVRAATFAAIGAGLGFLVGLPAGGVSAGAGAAAGAQIGLSAASGSPVNVQSKPKAKMASGGVARERGLYELAELGTPEAVVPLNGGAIPVEITLPERVARGTQVSEVTNNNVNLTVNVSSPDGQISQDNLQRITDAVSAAMITDNRKRRQLTTAMIGEVNASPTLSRQLRGA